jgi:tRNA U54 and U55 pseudouridine synthase Pus10
MKTSQNYQNTQSPVKARNFVIDLRNPLKDVEDETNNSGYESRRIINTKTIKKTRSKSIISKKNSSKTFKRTFTFKNLIKSQSKKNYLEESFPITMNNMKTLKEKEIKGSHKIVLILRKI